MKLCKDCKHCIPTKFLWWTLWDNTLTTPLRCERSRIKHRSLVDGIEWWSDPQRCDIARMDGEICGKDGDHWEAR